MLTQTAGTGPKTVSAPVVPQGVRWGLDLGPPFVPLYKKQEKSLFTLNYIVCWSDEVSFERNSRDLNQNCWGNPQNIKPQSIRTVFIYLFIFNVSIFFSHATSLSLSLCPSVWVAVGPVSWWIPIVRRSICEPYLILLICLQNKKKEREQKKKERSVEKHKRSFLSLCLGSWPGLGQMKWKTWMTSWLSPPLHSLSLPNLGKKWSKILAFVGICGEEREMLAATAAVTVCHFASQWDSHHVYKWFTVNVMAKL